MLKYINIFVYILIFGPQCFCEDTPNKFEEDAVLRFAVNQNKDVKYDIDTELNTSEELDSELLNLSKGIEISDDSKKAIDKTDPIDLKIDPADSNIDPIDLKIDPVDANNDPIDLKIDSVDSNIDPVDSNDDPIDLKVDPVDSKIDSIDVDPIDNDPIDNDLIDNDIIDNDIIDNDPVDNDPIGQYIDPIDHYFDSIDENNIDPKAQFIDPINNDPPVVDTPKKIDFNKRREPKVEPKRPFKEEYMPNHQDLYDIPSVAPRKFNSTMDKYSENRDFDSNTLQSILASECPAYAAKVAQEYTLENLPIWVQILISQTPILVILQDGIYTLYIQHWQTVANLFKMLYDILKEGLHSLIQISDQIYVLSPLVCQIIYGIIGFMLLSRILCGKFFPFSSRKPENVVGKLLENQQMQTLFTQMKKVANQPRVLSGDSKGLENSSELAATFERINQFMAQQQIQQERNQKHLVSQAQQLSDAIEQQSRFAIFIAQILRHIASNNNEQVPLPQLDVSDISGKQQSTNLASVAQDIFDMVSPRMMNNTNLDMTDVNSSHQNLPVIESEAPIASQFNMKSPRNAPPPSYPIKSNIPPMHINNTFHENPIDSRLRDSLTSRSASFEGHNSPKSETPFEYVQNTMNGIVKPEPVQNNTNIPNNTNLQNNSNIPNNTNIQNTKVNENTNPNTIPPIGGGWNPPNMKYPTIPQPNPLPNGTHNPPQPAALPPRQRRERKEPPKVQAATNPFGLNTNCVNPIPGEVDF